MNISWRRWKLGAVVAIFLSLVVAGAGLVAGMKWQAFVSVFCVALGTHFGSFLTTHPIDSISFDSTPPIPLPDGSNVRKDLPLVNDTPKVGL